MIPLPVRVFLVILCSICAYGQVRRIEDMPGVRLSIALMCGLSVLSLVALSGCSSAAPSAAVATADPVTWQMHRGYPIRWDSDAAPLLLVVHPDATMWQHHCQEAAQRWNDAVGGELVAVAEDITAVAEALQTNQLGIVPVLSSTSARAHTEFGILDSGRFVQIAIRLPSDLDLALYPSAVHVVTHEIGHALGLEHDVDHTSIMYPKLRIPPRYTPEIEPADAAALKGWYRL